MLRIKDICIDLDGTVTCGQIFRYEKELDNSYTIILNDRVINIKKDKNDLVVTSNKEEDLENVIRNYFDLNRSYDEMDKEILKSDNTLENIVKSCAGYKIINQSNFECAISYILSANNGVPQIRNSLNLISEKYGEKIIFNEKEYYLFPNEEKLKNVSIEDYRNLKTGFRDKYLYEFVQKVNNKEFDLKKINDMNSVDAMDYLMTNKGIGEKVASCILLFSYCRLDVFPIDTWVKKFMKEKYNIEGVNNIRKFIEEKFGKYSGLVIQYMFHYKRNKELNN